MTYLSGTVWQKKREDIFTRSSRQSLKILVIRISIYSTGDLARNNRKQFLMHTHGAPLDIPRGKRRGNMDEVRTHCRSSVVTTNPFWKHSSRVRLRSNFLSSLHTAYIYLVVHAILRETRFINDARKRCLRVMLFLPRKKSSHFISITDLELYKHKSLIQSRVSYKLYEHS